MNSDSYAAKYVPIGYRTPSPEEIIARHVARDLKIPTAAAIQIAAPLMAALIDGPCWLVPVPASNGSLTANLTLARAIAHLFLVPVSNAPLAAPTRSNRPPHAVCAVFSVSRGTARHYSHERPHAAPAAYFVDNIITTGTTIAACHSALGWGIGLAFADASRSHYACCFRG